MSLDQHFAFGGKSGARLFAARSPSKHFAHFRSVRSDQSITIDNELLSYLLSVCLLYKQFLDSLSMSLDQHFAFACKPKPRIFALCGLFEQIIEFCLIRSS
jgi:hypothetical protein